MFRGEQRQRTQTLGFDALRPGRAQQFHQIGLGKKTRRFQRPDPGRVQACQCALHVGPIGVLDQHRADADVLGRGLRLPVPIGVCVRVAEPREDVLERGPDGHGGGSLVLLSMTQAGTFASATLS